MKAQSFGLIFKQRGNCIPDQQEEGITTGIKTFAQVLIIAIAMETVCDGMEGFT